MRKEGRVFFAALMFYTRIPCPSWVDHSEEYVNKSVRYFPLIGWIVGGVAFLFLYLGSLIDPFIGALSFLAASILLTGAFHEDGFADVCDGFGGGWTKEQVLNIMKDSRVGTYAVIGLLILLLAKLKLVVLMFERGMGVEKLLFITLIGHSLSRWAAATIIFTHEYARDDEKSKTRLVAKSFTPANVLISSILGFIPVFIFVWYSEEPLFFVLIPMVYLLKMLLANWFKRKIGGYTGDCLGAVQQVGEVFIYLLLVLLGNYV
ncbi:MAG: adenosylcobinamide-GDP ribazoletransferase [Bacteroidota bacterium]